MVETNHFPIVIPNELCPQELLGVPLMWLEELELIFVIRTPRTKILVFDDGNQPTNSTGNSSKNVDILEDSREEKSDVSEGVKSKSDDESKEGDFEKTGEEEPSKESVPVLKRRATSGDEDGKRAGLVKTKRTHFKTIYRNIGSIEKDINKVGLPFPVYQLPYRKIS